MTLKEHLCSKIWYIFEEIFSFFRRGHPYPCSGSIIFHYILDRVSVLGQMDAENKGANRQVCTAVCMFDCVFICASRSQVLSSAGARRRTAAAGADSGGLPHPVPSSTPSRPAGAATLPPVPTLCQLGVDR